jgi:hypothetical protein
MRKPRCRWDQIFFSDIPSLIDSTWRHIDFQANAERHYVLGTGTGAQGSIEARPRPYWRMPPFWMFAFLVFFVSYGPNWNGLCATAPELIVTVAQWLVGLIITVSAVVVALRFRKEPRELVRRRFDRLRKDPQLGPVAPCREGAVTFFAYVAAFVALALAVVGAGRIAGFGADPPACAIAGGNLYAFFRFAMCFVAVAAIGIYGSRPRSTTWLLYAQVAAIIAVALVHWFLLAGPSAQEVSDLPYRHVFALWAPCIVAVLLLAPVLAKIGWTFPSYGASTAADEKGLAADDKELGADAKDLKDEAECFEKWLGKTELFAPTDRGEPSLSSRRLFFAAVYGPFYHPLHLLLIPAWVALVAPPQFLYVSGFTALVASFFLLVWGHISTRWDQMNVHIERWFLRGVPLIVSVLVIALALLRVLQFDYVSTILDALPFGMFFGMVVMTYMLFWFVEYWMNRVLAVRLLQLLKSDRNYDEIAIGYPRTTAVPQDVGVSPEGRFLMSHGMGRLIAVGTVTPRAQQLPGVTPEPPPAQQRAGADVPDKPGPKTAFNTFYFKEAFSRLGEWAETPKQKTYSTDIERRMGNYFFILNAAMALVTLAFLVYYALNHMVLIDGVDPVLTAAASPAASASVDLASFLEQGPGQPARPAIVVVGSGGGTRAALYTATVLRGLHRLGVDQDIVLLSGVSGGGVALAYFAANRDALVAEQDDERPCSENPSPKLRIGSAWNCFEKSMTEPFIEDVLNSATEWRVFSRTALSELLAESFQRRLFGSRTLGSVGAPALILNSAIVSHPAEDSDLLGRTLNAANIGKAGCEETERSYKLMSGGRLIFTNIRDWDTGEFPSRRAAIPDVRLGYEIMRDADIPLATAAALNANFPPVFPSARVRVENGGDGPCRFKDYYVTDGGAVENLGLVSALYALESAVETLPAGSKVRPIHVVLAEASAVTYDYGQDRGLSAIEGSRERLAGGLTVELIAKLKRQLATRGETSPKIEFYYLGLPLAFRARGGFGTHWMYAKEYHLNDPRPRSKRFLNFLPGDMGRDRKALIDQNDLRKLWLALHDPDKPFCRPQQFHSTEADKVWTWICGSPPDLQGRDLHMGEWQRLVDEMRASPK